MNSRIQSPNPVDLAEFSWSKESSFCSMDQTAQLKYFQDKLTPTPYQKSSDISGSTHTYTSILPEIFCEHIFLNNNNKSMALMPSEHIHILLQLQRQQQHQLRPN